MSFTDVKIRVHSVQAEKYKVAVKVIKGTGLYQCTVDASWLDASTFRQVILSRKLPGIADATCLVYVIKNRVAHTKNS